MAAHTFGEPTRAARADLVTVVEQIARGATGQCLKWLQEVKKLLNRRIADADVVVQDLTVDASDTPEVLHRILIADQRRAKRDDEARQTWTPDEGEVTLDQHQSAVAERAAAIGIVLGLGELVEVLRLAGLHHDDGKADPRFQIALDAPDDVAVAKSELSPARYQA